MSIFTRRFLSDPGSTVLLNIESVNIIDLAPPSSISGIGTGTVCVVGEFENGPFNTPSQVMSAADFLTKFGGLGYQYGGIAAQNPCARQRSADSAIAAEFWNGNGFVQLNAKSFANLVVCRANTSVGAVSVSRAPFLTGAASFRYQLVAGQVLQLDLGAGPTSATFSATAATVTAVGGTYNTTFTGGQTLVLGYDGAPNFTTTFLAADQTVGQVIARINQYAGFAFATNTAGQITLTGLQLGTGAQVRVVSGSSGVLAQLGLTGATTAGTGNVANISQVSPAEIAVVVQGAIANSKVEVDQNGALRISNTVGGSSFIAVGSGTTATALGFLSGAFATDNGEPILVSGAGTYNLGTTGTIVFQLGNKLAQVTATVTSGHSLAQTVTDINSAFTTAGQGAPVSSDGAARLVITSTVPGDTIQVVSASAGAILTELGLLVGSTVGVLPPQGLLPAGTQVGISGGSQYVTMQDVSYSSTGVVIAGVVQANASSYSVPIRPAQDDGTGTGTGAGTVVVFAAPPAIGAFTVTNPQVVAAAPTEAAIDDAYSTAIGSTVNVHTVASQINVIFSARQSNAVRSALRQNALSASANGCFGRMAIVRPPLNTLESTALSLTAQPGVGATSDQRVVYTYPGANTFVPAVAAVGTSGGVGFTATGNVDVGSDGFLASVLSQLNPEEDPGQLTTFTGGANGLESGANVQGANGGAGFQMADYIAFKAAGICAPRMDNGTFIFQSGCTSVNPQSFPTLADINRRRIADFIQDSIAIAMKPFGKQLATVKRRNAIVTEIQNFLTDLAGGGPGAKDGNPNNPDSQRILSFRIDLTANTQALLGRGLFRVIVRVTTISSLKSIVIQTEIGPTVVTVTELAA